MSARGSQTPCPYGPCSQCSSALGSGWEWIVSLLIIAGGIGLVGLITHAF